MYARQYDICLYCLSYCDFYVTYRRRTLDRCMSKWLSGGGLRWVLDCAVDKAADSKVRCHHSVGTEAN